MEAECDRARHVTAPIGLVLATVTVALGLGACRPADDAAALHEPAPDTFGAALNNGPLPEVRLLDGLGGWTRRVTTSAPDAQRYFDQGLALVSGFNHDEAIRAFRRATELDPACAMAWWGIALANGPHINRMSVSRERERAAVAAITRAGALAAGAIDVERALIEALATRYAEPQPADRTPLNAAYADAMREVWRAFPDDADVGALFAEALLDVRPWELWATPFEPTASIDELISTLETVLVTTPDHPLANHLYIHVVEASDEPGRADAAAERLRDYAPGLGHLTHMPSHIDVRRGRWEQAIVANRKAIAADRAYAALRPEQGFERLYALHNPHMLAYAAMMTGRSELAVRTMREMIASIPERWLREQAFFADAYVAMPLEVLMRFGRWEEILAEPEPAEYLPVSRALRHYARGVAYAATGRADLAEREQRRFVAARAEVHPHAVFGSNRAAEILDVAGNLLAGEIHYRRGEHERAFEAMREGVRREDLLRYDEPPSWIQPVRHALGASLLQSGRLEEAEAVYREDLRRHPDNGWSLFGLGRSLRRQGRDDEAARVEARFAKVWNRADIKLASSCFCQPGEPATPTAPGARVTEGSDFMNEFLRDPSAAVGVEWQWISTTTPVEQIDVAEPGRYTIELGADGRLTARFDCNRGGGEYEIGEGRLSFGPMMSTRAMCPADSLDTRFIRDLGFVSSFFLRGGELYLELPADGGTLRFRRAPG